MKLTAEQIAKIEEFLTEVETQTAEEVGKKYGLGKTKTSRITSVSTSLRLFRCLGVPCGRSGVDAAELKEFRAWKTARANGHVASKTGVPT